jgi:hypothetical protein
VGQLGQAAEQLPGVAPGLQARVGEVRRARRSAHPYVPVEAYGRSASGSRRRRARRTLDGEEAACGNYPQQQAVRPLELGRPSS